MGMNAVRDLSLVYATGRRPTPTDAVLAKIHAAQGGAVKLTHREYRLYQTWLKRMAYPYSTA